MGISPAAQMRLARPPATAYRTPTVVEFLTHAGFTRITPYTNPTHALQEIQAWPSDTTPIVVISDYQMPGMTGLQLLDKLTSLLPMYGILVTGDPLGLPPHGYPLVHKVTPDFRKQLVQHIHAGIVQLSKNHPSSP